MGPWLFGGLIALSTSPPLSLAASDGMLIVSCAVMTGIVGIFIPFGRTMDLLYAGGGTLLFSGYIVYDTYMINKRLSPDEYIMGAISLYLECVLSYFLLSARVLTCVLQLHQPL